MGTLQAMLRYARRRWYEIGTVLVLLVVAIRLRRHAFGPPALWLDDAWVALVHRSTFGDVLTMSGTAPGFGWVLRLWFDVVGFGERRAQLPALFFGVLAVVAVYVILRQRVHWVVAAGAAAAVVLAPAHIAASTMVKQYTAEVVLALLLNYFALRCLDGHEGARPERLLAVVAAMALFVSFTLVVQVVTVELVVIAVALHRAYAGDGGTRWLRQIPTRVAWAALPAVASVAVYLMIVVDKIDAGLNAYWSGFYVDLDHGRRQVLKSLFGLLGQLVRGVTALPVGVGWVWLAVVGVLAWRRPERFALAILPLLVAVALAGAGVMPLGGGRTDLHLLPSLVLGAAFGIEELRLLTTAAVRVRAMQRVALAAAVICGALAGVLAVDQLEVKPYPEENIKPLLAQLDHQRRAADVVVVYYSARFDYLLYTDEQFHALPDGHVYLPVFERYETVALPNYRPDPSLFLPVLREADARVEPGGRLWLIGQHLWLPDWTEIQRQITEELGYKLASTVTSDGAELLLFDR